MIPEEGYGEIENLSSTAKDGVRTGDYGKDSDGNVFCYTVKQGWRPMHPVAYEAYYWEKKYNQLLKIKELK